MDNRDEVRDFLTTRRARITPTQAGLPDYGGNRRVPGLRREEVALLAGISVDYYTRLERGNLAASPRACSTRSPGPSSSTRPSARTCSTWPGRPRPARPPRAAGRRRTRVRPACSGSSTRCPARRRTCATGALDILAVNGLGRALYAASSTPRPLPVNLARFAVPRPACDGVLPRLGPGRERLRRHAARRGRPDAVRPRADGPGRRALHPQRGVPHPVGRGTTSGCTAPARSGCTTRCWATSS